MHPESTEIKFLACWNIRILIPGFNTDSDLKKTFLLNHELDRLNVDIAALSETRLPENGSIKKSSYTIFWHGKPQGQKNANMELVSPYEIILYPSAKLDWLKQSDFLH